MKKRLILFIAFAVVAVSAWAALPAIRMGWDSNGGRVFKTEAGTEVLTVGTTGITSHGTTALTGAVTAASTVAITGATTLSGAATLDGAIVIPRDNVSLTSPTVTFSAAGKSRILLNSDANQTGFHPTGGVLGQEIVIFAGSGSNTMRFDDGTSMTLGGNLTMTEGQVDRIWLRCTSADGDEWELVTHYGM